MTSSRNKRKRAENDSRSNPAPSSSRRRPRTAPAGSSNDESKDPKKDPAQPPLNNDGGAVAGEGAVQNVTESAAPAKAETSKANADQNEKPSTSKRSQNDGIPPDKPLPTADAGGNGSSQKTPKTAPQHDLNPEEGEKSSGGSSVSKSTSPSDTQNGTGAKSQVPNAARIMELIAHRTLLLRRIQSCRAAAIQKLEAGLATGKKRMSSEDQLNRTPLHSAGTSILSVPPESSTDEEIEAFRELSKMATQTVKKGRGESETASDKRTSLSLRRGASVGKKMNAALSSLAPGAGSLSISVSTDTIVVPPPMGTPTGRSSIMPSPRPQPQPTSLKSLPKSGMPVSANPPPPIVIPRATSASKKSVKKSNAHGALTPRSSGNAQRALTPVSENHAGPNKSIKNSSNRSSSSQMDPPSQPQHIASPPPMLPHNQLARPEVVNPEAAALRSRQAEIRSNLAAMFDRQESLSNIAAVSDQNDASRNKSRPNRSSSKMDSKFPPWVIPPSRSLPPRRKTHWDYLLEEMSWLATDFTEERRWKQASLKELSLSVANSSRFAMQNENTEMEAVEAISHQSEPPPEEEIRIEIPAVREPVISGLLLASGGLAEKLYPSPNDEDLSMARKVASRISGMIHLSDSEREVSGSSLAENSTLSVSETTGVGNGKASIPVIGRTDKSAGGTHPDNESSEKSDQTAETSFESITDFIEETLQLPAESIRRQARNQKPRVSDPNGIRLALGQKEAIEFVEELWGRPSSPGSILSGPAVSGKTFSTCYLLWKQRTSGLQILICAPACMMRWTHELSRFMDLRVFTFSKTDGIFNSRTYAEQIDGLQSGDVIVCEYASVSSKLIKLLRRSPELHSIVLDCRHPVSFRQSHGAGPRAQRTQQDGDNRDLWLGPPELISIDWWGEIMKLLSRGGIRRLLIEYPDPDTFSLSGSGLNAKEKLEILAFRTMCIVGPSVFHSPTSLPQRRVLSWARRRGKRSTVDKVKRIRHVLEDVTLPYSLELEGLVSLEASVEQASSNSLWELRSCELNEEQRRAYEKACLDLRGSLSSCLVTAEKHGGFLLQTFDRISSAVLCIRQLCVHADIAQLIIRRAQKKTFSSVGTLRGDRRKGEASRLSQSILLKVVEKSPSQPNAETASAILRGSAKLRELLTILKNDCDLDLGRDDSVKFLEERNNEKSAGRSRQKRKPASSHAGPKRIAILAVLPEVLLLVSTLFNSVGLKHDLLLRSTHGTRSGKSNSPDYSKENHASMAIAWAQYQTVLSRFNSDSAEDDGDGLIEGPSIILVSPVSLAGIHGGLGIDKADFVISLDEDWSGRGEMLMKHAVARWYARNRVSNNTQSRFIRLVCAGTWEEQLLQHSPQGQTRIRGRIDHNGNLEFPSSESEARDLLEKSRDKTTRGVFTFPGMNWIKHRGEPLSEMLLPLDPLPPHIGTGANPEFLPLSSVEYTNREIEAEINLIRALADREETCSMSLHFDQSTALCATHCLDNTGRPASFCYSSPAPIHFPEELICRRNLSAVALQLSQISNVDRQTPSNTQILEPNHLKSGPADSRGNVVSAIFPAACDSERDFECGWASDISGNTSAHIALFYAAAPNPSDGGSTSNDLDKNEGRRNAYANVFSSSFESQAFHNNVRSSEPLVYFPPLFPGVVQSSINATANLEATKIRLSGDKRKEDEGEALPEPKRQRSQLYDPIGEHISHQLNSPERFEVDSAIPEPDDNLKFLSEIDEDFGLIGAGAIPSSFGASTDELCIWAGDSLYCDHPLPTPDTTDIGDIVDVDANRMESVILFVKKNRGFGAANEAASSYYPPPPQTMSSYSLEPAGPPGKKGRKISSQAPHSGYSLPTWVGVPQVAPQNPASKGKDGFANSLLSSFVSRQIATGLTLFESAAYSTAATSVQNRVAARLNKSYFSRSTPVSGAQRNSGYDRLRNWECLVKAVIKDTKSDDQAGTGSFLKKQRIIRKTLEDGTTRVDFGPFSTGSISPPSDLVDVAPHKQHIGVTLPMGVKVPQVGENTHQLWNEESDRRLQEFAARYEMNWTMVAMAMTGFIDSLLALSRDMSNSADHRSHPRSARQCQNRWQHLASAKPDIVSKSSDPEVDVEPNMLGEASSKPSLPVESEPVASEDLKEDNLDILLSDDAVDFANVQLGLDNPSEDDYQLFADSLSPTGSFGNSDDKASQPKGRFSAVSAARAKKRNIPIAIPGVVSGGPLSLVPSHPSHGHSVQAAVAAQASRAAQIGDDKNVGRAEMWPLQILDAADKMRRNAQQASRSRSSVLPSSSAASVSSSVATRRTGNTSSHSSHGHHSVPPPVSKAIHGHTTPSNSDVRISSQDSQNQHAQAIKQQYVPPPTSAAKQPEKQSKDG